MFEKTKINEKYVGDGPFFSKCTPENPPGLIPIDAKHFPSKNEEQKEGLNRAKGSRSKEKNFDKTDQFVTMLKLIHIPLWKKTFKFLLGLGVPI